MRSLPPLKAHQYYWSFQLNPLYSSSFWLNLVQYQRGCLTGLHRSNPFDFCMYFTCTFPLICMSVKVENADNDLALSWGWPKSRTPDLKFSHYGGVCLSDCSETSLLLDSRSTPFRKHTDWITTTKLCPYWVTFGRIIATARGHKQRSVAMDSEQKASFYAYGRTQWARIVIESEKGHEAGLHVSLELLRRQKKSFGSHGSINLLTYLHYHTAVSHQNDPIRSAVHFHFYQTPPSTLSTFDQRRIPVLISRADKTAFSVQIYPCTFTKWAELKRILQYRVDR